MKNSAFLHLWVAQTISVFEAEIAAMTAPGGRKLAECGRVWMSHDRGGMGAIMGKKVQVVLDDETYRLLRALAAPRAGNKSFVVREALRTYADREQAERVLDGILAQRRAREAMDAGLAARDEGRLVPHPRVLQKVRGRKKAR